MKHLQYILHRHLSLRQVLILSLIFFSIRIFFQGHWQLIGHQGKRGDHLLFHSTTSTRSQTFRHLFATLHVRWLSYIFHLNTCIYQTATCWDFPTLSNCHLIDWWCEVCFGFFPWWFDTRFLLQQSWYRKPVDSNLHRLSLLYYKRTDQPSVLVTPNFIISCTNSSLISLFHV